MEILFLGNDVAECKVLANALSRNDHAVTWCLTIADAKKNLDLKIWNVEVLVCRLSPHNPSEGLKLAEHTAIRRLQRGYHHKPLIILISSHIDETLRKAASLSGAFLCAVKNGDYSSLISYINFIREQELLRYLGGPYLLIHHSVPHTTTVHCTDEEKLIGISVVNFGQPEPTDQTPHTAVLIDYLCQQHYPKSEEEISFGIASNPFYMAQLNRKIPPPTSIKHLVHRSRERLEPGLKATQSKATADMLIRNVAGHTRMYKFDGLVRVVHVPEFHQRI
jgi:hypothetical protein